MAHSEKKWTLCKCVLQTKESLAQCYTKLVDVSIGAELDNASQKREQVIIERLNDQAVIHPCFVLFKCHCKAWRADAFLLPPPNFGAFGF
jgi:hypothetical protein